MKIKTVLMIAVMVGMLSGLAMAYSETSIKGGFYLSKGEEHSASWLLIHEKGYYIGGLVSIGYETQFSYFKVDFDYAGETLTSNVFPVNIFFNAKILLIKRGLIRPYLGGGVGIQSTIIQHPERFIMENYGGAHAIAGLSIGKGVASFLIELRFRTTRRPEGLNRFAVVAGISY
jgi:hypothetical protein